MSFCLHSREISVMLLSAFTGVIQWTLVEFSFWKRRVCLIFDDLGDSRNIFQNSEGTWKHRCSIMVAFTDQQKIDNVGEDSSQKQFTSVCFLFAGELENAVMKLSLISFIRRHIQKILEPTESNCLGVLGKSWNCQILVISVVSYI